MSENGIIESDGNEDAANEGTPFSGSGIAAILLEGWTVSEKDDSCVLSLSGKTRRAYHRAAIYLGSGRLQGFRQSRQRRDQKMIVLIRPDRQELCFLCVAQ